MTSKSIFAEDLQGSITGRDLALLFAGALLGMVLGLYWAWVLKVMFV